MDEPSAFRPNWDKAWAQVGTARDVEGKANVSERVDDVLAEAVVREMEASYGDHREPRE